MSNGGISLTDAQRAGIERTDLSLALTSGAGCGKTFVLSRRYVKLLTDDGGPDAPSRIVAVTFTDKAAIEMRERVADLLAERAAEADDEPTRRRYQEWLSRMPDARISTIHGFCGSVLRAHAVEAGLDPAFGVLADEFVIRRLLGEAVDRAARQAFDEPDDNHRELLSAFPYKRILDLLTTAVTERWRWSADEMADPDATLRRWDTLREGDLDAVWNSIDHDWVNETIDELRAKTWGKSKDKLAVHIETQLTLIRAMGDDASLRTAEMFKQLKPAGSIGSRKLWGAEEIKAVRASLKGLIEEFRRVAWAFEPLNDADRRSARCLAALTSIADKANQRYAAAKRREGLLDYDDLLIKTHELLVTNKAVRRRVSGEIRQLLIDEFQDTDSLQRELLYLAVGCEGLTPDPGRVFFVGDAKQSIYRFRGAEVGVFNQARDAMGEQGQYSLDLNFRTHAGGISLVNRVFEPLMGEEYEPLVAKREATPAQPASEILWVDCGPKAKREQRVRASARAIAGRIAEMLRDGVRRVWDEAAGDWRSVRPGDIAILMPQLRNTAPYEDALHDAGVDYYVVAGVGLFRQQEVFDLTNALRAIDNPLDDVALMGFLRSGIVGLDDNALAVIANSTSSPYSRHLRDERLASALSDGDRDALTRAADLLSEMSAVKDVLCVDEILERLLDATGFEAVLLGQYNGRRKAGNVRRVLARAREASAGGATLREFVDYLMELTVEEVRAEQAATEAEGGDVVRIMTVHKSKGLEFPVVFLGDMNFAPRLQGDVLGYRSHWGVTLKVTDDKDNDPLGWSLANFADQQKEFAENQRRFYVALTRHEDFASFVVVPEHKHGRLGGKGSTLRLLDRALDIDNALSAGAIDLGQGRSMPIVRWQSPARRTEVTPSWLDHAYAAAGDADTLATVLDAKIGQDGGEDGPPLLAEVPGGAGGRFAVTALGEFEACPARFRWQYELRTPVDAITAAEGPVNAPEATGDTGVRLDAATAGTLYHRCMELLDFAHPQSPTELAEQALVDLTLDADPSAVAAELEGMLRTLRTHPLWETIATAERRLPELAFVTRFGSLEVEGVIDLLIRDAAGAWRIIDYKSDRVDAAAAAEHGRRYELQMLVYAAAAGRFIAEMGQDGGVADATLYFLRPGVTHVFGAAQLSAEMAEARLSQLADRLADCRRRNVWPRTQEPNCAWCRYGVLCRRS